ncbi:MAG: simple sugar transport system substrate-binding protein [Pontimonas sp.]|jgi:simple sugar transport system substrate-binding protein
MFRKSRLPSTLIGSVATIALLAACAGGADSGSSSSSESGEESTASGDKFRIVTVSKIEGITWFQRMSEGVDMFNDENSDVVEAYQTGPQNHDPAEQVQIVEDLIAQGVDALIVVPIDPVGMGPLLQRARDAGIIVGVTEATALVDSTEVDFDVEAFDNNTFGRGFGEGLCERMGGTGQYATSVGQLTSESHMLWLQGAIEYIEENCPDMENVSPTPFENQNDDQVGYDLAKEILGTFPDLDGYIGTTPAGVSGMARALAEANKTDIVNTGLSLPSVVGPEFAEGWSAYAQGWDPAGWGWALNAVALKLLQGEEVADGADLGWPGYESIKIVRDNNGSLLIEGNDIQPYDSTTFPDGNYPF